MLRTALLFSAILLTYDALAAVIAKWLTISYNSFLIPALVMLFFMGVYAGRKGRSWVGLSPVVFAAVADATLGWYIASLIGPGFVPGWTTRELLVMGAESALLSIAAGFAGVWTGLRVYFSSR